jgi:hypothetical protein
MPGFDDAALVTSSALALAVASLSSGLSPACRVGVRVRGSCHRLRFFNNCQIAK